MENSDKKDLDIVFESALKSGRDGIADDHVRTIIQDLINTFPYYVLVIDEDHNILFANDTVLKTMEKTQEELHGCFCPKAIHNMDGPFPGCPLEDALKTNSFVEKDLLDPAYGNWVSSTIYPMNYKTVKGKKLFLHIAYDITERKKSEEMIKKQNEFLENVLESLTQPFFVIDIYDHTVVMANTAAGIETLEENTKCYAVSHNSKTPCDGNHHPCPITEILKTKKPVIVEHTHTIKNGDTGIFEVHGYPIFDDEGNVIRIIEYTLDITKRKEAEKQVFIFQKDLEVKSKNLEEHNIALNVLLSHQEEEKNNTHKTILDNIKTLVLPYVEKLKTSSLNETQTMLVNILESNLVGVTKPFSSLLMNDSTNLSPTEVRVANMIKEGKTAKEIAKVMYISENTVKAHYRNIRSKLDIRNKKVNLRTHLQSLSNV